MGPTTWRYEGNEQGPVNIWFAVSKVEDWEVSNLLFSFGEISMGELTVADIVVWSSSFFLNTETSRSNLKIKS